MKTDDDTQSTLTANVLDVTVVNLHGRIAADVLASVRGITDIAWGGTLGGPLSVDLPDCISDEIRRSCE